MTDTLARAKPLAHASGGTPAGRPDYKPINKLPRHEQLALVSKLMKPVLYQVVVEQRSTGNSLAVSPKISLATAQALAETINTQVALGNEKLWANAQVNLVL